jgi:TonB family protein
MGEKRAMTAAMHQLFERRPLAGAVGVGLVAHVGAVLVLLLVVRASAEPPEPDTVDVISVDDDRLRTVAADIERAAAVIVGPSVPIIQPGPRPRQFRYIAQLHAEAPKETRVLSARVAAISTPRPAPAEPSGEGGPRGALIPAAAVLHEGPGERAPIARERETPPPPPVPAPGALGKGTIPPRQVALAEEPILAAPAVIAPVADQTAVRARASALALFMRQIEASISRNWFPQSVYTRVDPSGTIQGVERRTAMRVRVRADGSLERLDVESTSGVPALDEEALAAFHRAKPFPKPPALALDSKGGLTFPFSVTLDLELARFKSDVKRMVGATWRPRGRLYVDQDRITVVRTLLSPEGVVASSTVESTSGSSFLDGSALQAITAGMRLPRPPQSLGQVAGMVPLRIAFVHRFRGEHDLQVLAERSDE